MVTSSCGAHILNKITLIIFVFILSLLSTGQAEVTTEEAVYDPLSSSASKTLIQLGHLDQIPNLGAVQALGQFYNPQVEEEVIRRLTSELKMSRQNTSLIQALVSVLYTYIVENKKSPKYLLENMNLVSHALNLFKEQYKDNSNMHRTLQLFKELNHELARIRSDELDLILHSQKKTDSLTLNPGSSLLVYGSKGFQSVSARLESFKNQLEQNLVGQSEIKQVFYDLEYQTLIEGNSQNLKVPFVVIMGPPSFSGQTSVEAYVNSLTGNPRASKENIFTISPITDRQEFADIKGAGKGYIGSEGVTEFAKFIIRNSGGKYILRPPQDEEHKYETIELNPEWSEIKSLNSTSSPSRAVILLPDLEKWEPNLLSNFLTSILKSNHFDISSSGDGVKSLDLQNIRIIATTSRGSNLILNVDRSGAAYGAPLDYEAMKQRYLDVANNKSILIEELFKNDTKVKNRGIPETLRSYVSSSRIVLKEPLSPEQFKEVVKKFVENIFSKYQNPRGAYGAIPLEISERYLNWLQEYDYLAQAGTAGIEDKMQSHLEIPFLKALEEANLPKEIIKKGFYLDIKQNEDKSYSLQLVSNNEILKERLILPTLKEIDREPITDERIEHLLGLKQRLSKRIVGQEAAIDLVANAVLLNEEKRYSKVKNWNDHTKASSFAFFGPSSTGKSEMSKAILNELYPKYGESKRVDIDFNRIKTPFDVRTYFWGHQLSNGDIEPSVFMKKYDEFNGDIILSLEEISNSNTESLTALYDLFREAHPKFIDGKDRPMTRVTLIATGNIGKEVYENIPKHLPIHVQIEAWSQAHQNLVNNEGLQRTLLEQYLPTPLINRIGLSNIVWFAPLGFKELRELSHLKLKNSLQKFKPQNGLRSWNVGFRNSEDVLSLIQIIEREGFILHEQGASIDRYVDEQFYNNLRRLLLAKKVPQDTSVIIIPRDDQTEESIKKQKNIKVTVRTALGDFDLEMKTQKRNSALEESNTDKILTAAHEAGHALVRSALLPNLYRPNKISIIPGLSSSGIYYAGIASHSLTKEYSTNRDFYIREIAVLLAGYIGEQFASAGYRHGSGKSNDIQRATKLAEAIVLKYGLEPEWGMISTEKENLSNEKKIHLETLVKAILKEAEELAWKSIQVNKALHLELTRALATKGEVRGSEIEQLMETYSLKPVEDWNPTYKTKMRSPVDLNHTVDLQPEYQLEEVVNIQNLVEKKRQKDLAKANLDMNFSYLDDLNKVEITSNNELSCVGFFN